MDNELLLCARTGDLARVKVLLQEGYASVTEADTLGRSALSHLLGTLLALGMSP
jgi:hypothetical protein